MNSMKSIEQELAVVSTKSTPKGTTLIYWVVTGLFCLQMSFTAYAQLSLPHVAEMFTHLGFPTYFRVELSWAKLLGVILLLAPVPSRLKEWAYAGFAINRLGPDRALLLGGWPRGLELGGRDRCDLGVFVLLLAPSAANP